MSLNRGSVPLFLGARTSSLNCAKIFYGSATTTAGVRTDVDTPFALDIGSMYVNSSAGMVFMKVAKAGASTDWKQIVEAIYTAASRKAIDSTQDTLAALKLQDGGGSSTGWFDTTADGVRTYGLYLSMFRPTSGVFVGTAGVDDAGARISVRNYANTHTNYNMRAGNFGARNSNSATLGLLSGLLAGANNNAGTAPSVVGAEVNAENYGTNATLHCGLDVTIKNEAAKSTTQVGIRIRDLNNSITGPSDAAILVAEPTVASTGFTYIIDANGVDSPIKAFARLYNGAVISSGAQTTRSGVRGEVGTGGAIGSLYLSSAGKAYLKVGTAGADTDWEKVTTSAAD